MWASGLQDFGCATLAIDNRARNFPYISMSIDFDVDVRVDLPRKDKQEKRAISVFPIEDLHAACASLQRKVNFYAYLGGAADVNICLSINPHIVAASNLLGNGSAIPHSKLSNCLTPLTRIRGLRHVEIQGPLSHSVRSATIASMCDRRLSATETMGLIGAQMDQGDEASMEDDLKSAILAYKMALHTVRGSYFDRDGNDDIILIEGRFNGRKASQYV